MLQFKISLKCSTVHKYTLIMTAVSLVLTFLSQINKMNFIGTVYIISAILLGKLLHIKYALSISGTGCVFDLFYLLFHTSDSKWVYIRCVHFVMHLLTFLYETVWLVSVYCYVKQEEAILAAKNERSRIDQRPADPEAPSGPKSPEKTDAPPPGSGSTVTVADASPPPPPDGKAASGTVGAQPVDKNVENRTGNDPEKASSARDGKPAENDESARKPEKPPPPSGAAEPRPEENAAGVRKPDEPGNEPAAGPPVVADERPEKPPTAN